MIISAVIVRRLPPLLSRTQPDYSNGTEMDAFSKKKSATCRIHQVISLRIFKFFKNENINTCCCDLGLFRTVQPKIVDIGTWFTRCSITLPVQIIVSPASSFACRLEADENSPSADLLCLVSVDVWTGTYDLYHQPANSRCNKAVRLLLN